MKIIGLTGPSGAGKGVFGKVCREYPNIAYLDTDFTSRKVVEKGKPCLSELCAFFGDGILKTDGSLDRRKLASIAFADDKKHEMLNSITHKYITVEIKKWLVDAEKSGASLAVIDAPLLFESGTDSLCDVTVCVLCPYELRLSRIMTRDSIDENAARLRMSSQPSDDFYRHKCTYALCNNGNIDDFNAKVKSLITSLLS